MAKNHNLTKNDLIRNQELLRKIHTLIPQVYASIIITLIDYYGWNFEECKTLLEYDQAVWNKCNDEGVKMLKKCSDEYGIDLIEIVGGNDSGEGKRFM